MSILISRVDVEECYLSIYYVIDCFVSSELTGQLTLQHQILIMRSRTALMKSTSLHFLFGKFPNVSCTATSYYHQVTNV